MSTTEDSKRISSYIAKQDKFSDGLATLRKIFQQTEMDETIKWGAPTYTLDGKIVASIAGFKNHFTIWFHQGVFLKDKHKKLVNAQDGKTKGMRQWRFEENKQVDAKLVKEYIAESIVNQKAGKQIKPERKTQLNIPDELDAALQKNKKLKEKFSALTSGKQREFADHIAGAKQEKTRISRLDKSKPLILAGVGLNDKYKNC